MSAEGAIDHLPDPTDEFWRKKEDAEEESQDPYERYGALGGEVVSLAAHKAAKARGQLIDSFDEPIYSD